jgi:TetR/AcrR family transcriptional regulator, transcriptional repressor for nem operon
MGHSKADKALSRKRILTAAATRIREVGLDGVSVGELMKSVNLTHGGFYGHFESRDALVAEALELALVESEKTSADFAGGPDNMTVKSFINNYLSPAHRDRPSSGCAMAALAGDVSRADPDMRAIMAQQLKKSFGLLSTAHGGDDADAEQFAVSAWAMMIGALMMSRVMAGDPEADKVLTLARKSVLELAALHSEPQA